jgi:hypothetical protein
MQPEVYLCTYAAKSRILRCPPFGEAPVKPRSWFPRWEMEHVWDNLLISLVEPRGIEPLTS